MSRYFLTFTDPGADKYPGTVVTVSTSVDDLVDERDGDNNRKRFRTSYLYQQTIFRSQLITDDGNFLISADGFVFDTGIREAPAVFQHDAYNLPAPWLNGLRGDVGDVNINNNNTNSTNNTNTNNIDIATNRPTHLIVAIRSHLDWLTEQLKIPGLHFRNTFLTNTNNSVTQPAERIFAFNLYYRDRPVMVDDRVADYFNDAIRNPMQMITILRAEDFSSTISSFYLSSLFDEMSEKPWYQGTKDNKGNKRLKLIKSTSTVIPGLSQTVLALPLSQLRPEEYNRHDEIVNTIVGECRDFINQSIAVGYLPKSIPTQYLLLKTLAPNVRSSYGGRLLLEERVTYPVFSTTAMNRILEELHRLNTWPWVSSELSIKKVGKWYSLDYISSYRPDLIRVDEMRIFSNLPDPLITSATDQLQLVSFPRGDNVQLSLSRRLLADNRADQIRYLQELYTSSITSRKPYIEEDNEAEYISPAEEDKLDGYDLAG